MSQNGPLGRDWGSGTIVGRFGGPVNIIARTYTIVNRAKVLGRNGP